MDAAAWTRELEQARVDKDEFFKADHRSPLLHAARGSFSGLSYYRPDPAYRVVTELHAAEPAPVKLARTGGDEIVYFRVGWFEVQLPAGRVRVAAFRRSPSEVELFIPFRDATSGGETYGAGRYLEASPLPDGHYVVDFNMAYQPFCAYDERYTCPLPPQENRLPVAVRAGERLAKGA